MRCASVSEIHAYPSRPEGFEEPLFATAASKREVAEHLLRAPWLARACELRRGAGTAARAFEEPIELEVAGGRAYVVRRGRPRRRVEEVLECWRVVGDWWQGEEHPDRFVVRVLLSGGAVADLALQRGSSGSPGGWLLAGVVD